MTDPTPAAETHCMASAMACQWLAEDHALGPRDNEMLESSMSERGASRWRRRPGRPVHQHAVRLELDGAIEGGGRCGGPPGVNAGGAADPW